MKGARSMHSGNSLISSSGFEDTERCLINDPLMAAGLATTGAAGGQSKRFMTFAPPQSTRTSLRKGLKDVLQHAHDDHGLHSISFNDVSSVSLSRLGHSLDEGVADLITDVEGKDSTSVSGVAGDEVRDLIEV